MNNTNTIADGELLQIRCPDCGQVLFDGFKDYISKVRVKCACGKFWTVTIDTNKQVVLNPSPPKVSKGCYISSAMYLQASGVE